MRTLASYDWPGNVRELRSEVHRWAVFSDERVDVDDLSPEIRRATSSGPASVGRRDRRGAPRTTLREAVEAAELAAIREALADSGGNLLRAARALAVERNTLKRKLRAFGLYPPPP
jgi:DNA-binding NtrC family response regulator